MARTDWMPAPACAGTSFHGHDEMGLGPDPALLAYARVKEADEDDPVYRGLCDAYDAPEVAFAATRATTPDGVRAKLDRIACRCQWEPKRAFHACPLVPSIVADFAHIVAGRAL